MKKIVRLTENDLIKIVKRVIKENEDNKLKRYVEEEDEFFEFDPDEDEFFEFDPDEEEGDRGLDYADSIFYDEDDEEYYL